MSIDQERSGQPIPAVRAARALLYTHDIAGARFPAALQDDHSPGRDAWTGREWIPERVMHARSAGAHGYFEAYGTVGDEPAGRFTRALLFQHRGMRTPVFIRFSTVTLGGHSPETLRDLRGFAVKFYTEDGHWDLVGNNLPVSFVRDAVRFREVMRAFRPDPVTDRQDPRRIFDFVSATPAAMHMITWLFSPWGIPANYREMRGSGVHVYRWINDDDDAVLVKYHFHPKGGERNLTQEEANRIQAKNCNHATQDLYDAIERGDFPEWEMSVQIMKDAARAGLGFDPLDPTKVWPTERFPLRPVGRVVLDRNPQNYFAEVERTTFDACALVDGLDFCDDQLRWGRMSPHADTQHFRVGSSYLQLPIAPPRTRMPTDLIDGPIAYHGEHAETCEDPYADCGSGLRDGLDPEQMCGRPHPTVDQCHAAAHPPGRGDDYAQAGERFRSFEEWERDELIRNLVGALGECELDTRQRMVEHFRQCDREYGRRVAEVLGLPY